MLVLLSAAFAAMYPLITDRGFSPDENRVLAQTPEFTVQAVFSGEFMNDLELYLDDQIAARDTWMTAASDIRRAAGFREINGVYLGRDGYLFKKITDDQTDQKKFAANLAAIKSFITGSGMSAGNLKVMPVPAKDVILGSLLPDGAQMFSYEAAYARLAAAAGADRMIDIRPALSAAAQERQVYFRTDHHWTAAGAFAAFEAFRGGDQDAAPPVHMAADGFLGSLYSKVLCSGLQPDDFYLPDAGAEGVSVNAGGRQMDSCYDLSYLDKKDKYASYFGGNYAQVSILTGSAGGSLLIVKDSFANAFVPYLLAEYSRIDMIDLRYFTGSACQYIRDNGIGQVLLLYEMSDIMEDSNISKLEINAFT